MRRRTVWAVVAMMAAVAGGASSGEGLDPNRNHLVCYPVKGKSFQRALVVDNDLGSEEIATLKPAQICAPTQKTADPEGTDPVANVGVPYFTCYRFKVKGKRAKQTVTLTDQFGTRTVTVSRPNLLCAPSVPGNTASTTTTTAADMTSTTAAPSTTSTAAATTLAPTTTTTLAQATTTTSTTTLATTTTTTTTTTDTTTSSTLGTTTTTTPDTTTTTLAGCNLAEGDPQLSCTGVCPQGFSCVYTGAGNSCGCVPDAETCGAQGGGQCGSGYCPGGLQACQDGPGGCTCVDIG
jgi:hypothetical protein